MSAAETSQSDKPRPLWDHIEELSKRLKKWLFAFLSATIFFLVFPADLSFLQNPLRGTYAYKTIIDVILVGIKARLLPPDYTLIGGTVTTPLELIFLGAAIFGFTASLPVLAYELYKFVDPAIKPSEKQSIYPFVTSFSLLFVTGALFAFFVLLPIIFLFSIPFFQVTDIPATIYADKFYYLVFFTILFSGLTFTLPVFFVLLVKLRVLGTRMLVQNRKYVWATLLIGTALVSPDGGPLADAALFLPVIVMLEGSIRIARRYEKNQPPPTAQPEAATPARCIHCGGEMDAGGVFCGLCGRSRS